MQYLYAGLLTGFLTFVAITLLVEKSPKVIRGLIAGHYLLSDIVFTVLSFTVLPVVGTTTLVASASFCTFFTVYLTIIRQLRPYCRLETNKFGIVRIRWFDHNQPIQR
jgi:hypothetical protein